MQYKEGIKAWLNNRKISNEILLKFGISYDNDVTIPINDRDGNFLFNKHRRNPLLPETGPKYWYDKGGKAQLFGAEFIKDENIVVICEGELDALVLWSHNIPAVSSTGGAMTFMEEWAEILKDKQVYLCFDNDKAGCDGMVRTLLIIPQAKIILLPQIAGVKDITDYYMKGGDIRDLMSSAKRYIDIDFVREEFTARRGAWLPTTFHESWIEWWESEQIRMETIKKPKEAEKYEDEIKQAKSVLIEDVIHVGHDHKALCLWHTERSPSMHIYDDGHFYCFACGKHGDVIDIVMEKEKVDFKGAVKWLNGNK